MARTGRETFAVTTIGAGSPDYSQPVTAIPVERALVVKFPERELAGNRYDDAAIINFTLAQQEYVVGVNANAAIAGSWPVGTVAKDVAFYATQACFVRFNDPVAVQHPIPAALTPTLRMTKRFDRIYVTRDTVDGVLYCWIEG